MKKSLAVLVLAVAAAAGGGYWWTFLRVEEQDGGALTLYGNVEIRDVHLAFTDSERIAEVLVEEGQAVKKGEVIARLETDRLEARMDEAAAQVAAREAALKQLEEGTRKQRIAQAEAQVAAAEARVKNAEAHAQRLRKTAETGATSRQSLDRAEAELQVQRAVLNVRKKALDLAREGPRKEEIAQARALLDARRATRARLRMRLGDAELTSPANGVVQSRNMEPGEMASPNRSVVSLSKLERKWVRTYVSEPNLGLVSHGQPARIVSDSFPDKAFGGHVGFISPVAEFTPKSVETTELRTKLVYEVRIVVDDLADPLRLGMPVTVTLQTASPDDGTLQADETEPQPRQK